MKHQITFVIGLLVEVAESQKVFAWGGTSFFGEPTSFTNVATAMCGWRACVVLTEDKKVFAWGASGNDPIASGSTGAVPDDVKDLTNVATAMCGGNACVAVTEDNKVFAWGGKSSGGAVPDEVKDLTNVATAMCGRTTRSSPVATSLV
jgi:alpha-tubulin suppressor-like RCC1 family protein